MRHDSGHAPGEGDTEEATGEKALTVRVALPSRSWAMATGAWLVGLVICKPEGRSRYTNVTHASLCLHGRACDLCRDPQAASGVCIPSAPRTIQSSSPMALGTSLCGALKLQTAQLSCVGSAALTRTHVQEGRGEGAASTAPAVPLSRAAVWPALSPHRIQQCAFCTQSLRAPDRGGSQNG